MPPLLVAHVEGDYQMVPMEEVDYHLVLAVVKANDLPALNQILSRGNVKLDCLFYCKNINGYCQTLLHIAARNGYEEIIEQLIDNGATVDSRNFDPYCDETAFVSATPLHFASRNSQFAAARKLLDAGADTNAIVDDGRSVIHELLSSLGRGWMSAAQLDFCTMFLDRRHVIDVDAPAVCGTLIRHAAYIANGLPLMKVLLERGATLYFGVQSPLYHAIGRNDVEMVKFFINAGCPINENLISPSVHSVHIMSLLIPYVDIPTFTRQYQYSLCLAASEGLTDMMQLLLSHNLDVDKPFQDGCTPLLLACRNGSSLQAIELLLLHGADVQKADSIGFTPLHEAARGSRVELVKMLLEAGADVNARDDEGHIPLFNAGMFLNSPLRGEQDPQKASLLRLPVFRLLLESGTDTSILDDRNDSLLHGICRFLEGKNLNIVITLAAMKALIDFKVNLEAVNLEGDTALDMCSRLRQEELFDAVLQHLEERQRI